ncbi:MAG: PQQ-binding-like beta-propeller repeat protein [Actinobacteria bacterium]|nr:PQQ-binding-like beta-propeller repeat protein [Actinomycetota bacterium]
MRVGLCVTVLSVVVALMCAGCDWAQYFSGPGHTSANLYEPAFTVSAGAHFATAWSVTCEHNGCLPPLEAGGLVYVAELVGGVNPRTVVLRALDATTGAQRWSVVFNQVDDAEFLAIGNGLAYVVLFQTGLPDEVLGFDAANGGLQWEVSPPGATTEFGIRHENVVLDGTSLFVGATSPTRSALSAIDAGGHVVWSTNPPGMLDSVTADSGRTLYVSSHVFLTTPYAAVVPFLSGYAEPDGALQSTIELPAQAGVIVANRLAYVGSMAIHPDTGQVVWSVPGEVISIVTNSIALTEVGNDLIARDANTGALRWRAVGAAPTAAGTQTAAVAGALVFVAHPHVVDILSLQDGSLLGTTPPVSQDVDLVPANGHLYVDGALTLWAFAPTSV